MTEMKHICVCICTYKRPGRLDRLLRELRNQETEGTFNYSVIVVDNDRAESARPIAVSHSRNPDFAIRYYVEPCQNIAHARNMAVANAHGDFVAFIDDDELPSMRWLISLYRSICASKAAGVLGPVLPRFEITPPSWVIKGRLFERPAHASGEVLSWSQTRTGNALLRADLFKKESTWFRPEFGSGGEDRDFFKRMIQRGFYFIWCNEGPVYEILPPARWNEMTMMKRGLLRGKMSLISSGSNFRYLGLSLVAVLGYSILLPFLYLLSPLLGYSTFIKYLIRGCDHLGKILAFLRIHPVKENYIS